MANKTKTGAARKLNFGVDKIRTGPIQKGWKGDQRTPSSKTKTADV